MLRPNPSLGQPTRAKPVLKPILIHPWKRLHTKEQIFHHLRRAQRSQICQVAQGLATSPGPASTPVQEDDNIKFKKGFWTFLDVVAILGSVGGALASILNLFSGTYVLFLPLVLPVVSLLSALQREGLIAEDNRRAYDTLRVSLARDSTTLLADARGALEEVRRELRGQNTTAARLGTIEARLSSLEGSILSAGRSAREAVAGLGVLPERLHVEQRAMLEGLVGAMRVELRRAAESLANNETTALARLDARLAAVEGSLSGLEVAQSEGMRRLSMSLNSAMTDAEATLQSSIRNEVARSLEPVRRLPQMLAAALPPALAAAEAVEASVAGVAGVSGGAATAPAAVTAEQLQAIVGQEVEAAVARILDFQVDAFGRLSAVRPVPMDDEQWSALGRRLTRLERLVEGVPSGTEGALLQNGQVPAAVAAAVGELLAVQVQEARAEVTAAAARESEGVRNDILAAQVILRESMDGLAGALQPLRLGVTELQVAVASVAESQLQQQTALQVLVQSTAQKPVAAEQRTEENGETTAVAMAALPAVELARVFESLEVVAALLRDVDVKMDNVTEAMVQLPAAAAAAATAAATDVIVPQASTAAAVSLPTGPNPDVSAAAAVVAATAAAAATQQQQQLELQAGIEAMRETLVALTAQVGLIASRSPPPPPASLAGPYSGSLPVTAVVDGDGGGSPSPGAVSDMLAFEASLVPQSVPPERSSSSRGGSGDDLSEDGRATPSTAGASREEAYDMMIQLAEARRRSGSETSSSSSGPVSSRAVESNSGNEPHIRIEGLPPFQDATAAADKPPAAAAAAPENDEAGLLLLPPMQSELDGPQQQQFLPMPQQEKQTSLSLQQQQLQQQEPVQPHHEYLYAPAAWQPQSGQQANSRVAQMIPEAPPPLTLPLPGGAIGVAPDGMPPPYDRPAPMPYDETLPQVAAASYSTSPASFATSLPSPSFAPSTQLPTPPPSSTFPPVNTLATTDPRGQYTPEAGVYGWEQQTQQQGMPYVSYEYGPSPTQFNGVSGAQVYSEEPGYGTSRGAAEGFMTEAAQVPSWYGTPSSQQQQQFPNLQMQPSQTPPLQQQQQQQLPQQQQTQPPPASQQIQQRPPQQIQQQQSPQQQQEQQAPQQPPQTFQQQVQQQQQQQPEKPSQQAQQQQPQQPPWFQQQQQQPPFQQQQPQQPSLQQLLRFPFWSGKAANSGPPQQAANGGGPQGQPQLRSASPTPPSGGFPSPPALLGFGPLQQLLQQQQQQKQQLQQQQLQQQQLQQQQLQQQQLQQQQLQQQQLQQQQQQQQQPKQQQPTSRLVSTATAGSPPSPPLYPPSPTDYRLRPLEGMNVSELLSEGLRLLRMGREETRKGEDYGLADTLVQASITAFSRAAEQPGQDAKALGNLGNALLARGELKAAYLEALRSGPPPGSPAEATAQMEAERAMTLEANGLLTEAGNMFLKVLEMDGWSSRALVNWGRALLIRADLLAATPDGLSPGAASLSVVAQLYTSAIDKFEGVLEGEPDMVPAKYRCALAMAGLSHTRPRGSRERITLLADAINYLRDVMTSSSPDAEALRPAAAAALQQYEAQLMAQRAVRQ